ncbi:extracellular solute-binding protein [Candidatus Jorgensenbacteria bacterium]|nr:extracellular solute-binding protein [Candidatus Jorgensenbacteria bacterium]
MISKNQFIFIGVILFLITIVTLLFLGIIPGLKLQPGGGGPTEKEITLEFWGLFDGPDAYTATIQNFKYIYPHVTVKYRSFNDIKTYEHDLIEALAEGRGPDVFTIKNTDLLKYTNKALPVDPNKLSIYRLRELFPAIVEQDFAPQGFIFALPTSIDTLALIVNRDILNRAGIVFPPGTWEDFKSVIPKLTKKERTKIVEAAASIGGSGKTVTAASDILSLLMLQTGTTMVKNDVSAAVFASELGLNALNFYTQFSDATKDSYTWNDTLPRDVDFFGQEKIAMMFGYSTTLAEAKSKNAFLNAFVSPILQPKSAVKHITYASYFGYVTSKQSKAPDVAWDFILELTTNESNVSSQLFVTKRPPALLTLINQAINDPSNPDMAVFAKQALIARAWPKVDSLNVDQVFSGLIESVITGAKNPGSALEEAQGSVTSILSRRSL